MNIHEYQAKELLAKYGIGIPAGHAALTVEEAVEGAKKLPGPLYVVKAQIHAGGRGKGTTKENPDQHGVQLVRSAEEAREVAQQLLGKTLVTIQTGEEGKVVNQVLVEQGCDIARELYLGIVLDRASKMPVLMCSTEGGMEIEKVAEETPELIFKEHFDPHFGLQGYQVRKLCSKLGIVGASVRSADRFMRTLCRLYVNLDCSLAEINPLVVTGAGELIALDAKISFDSNAMYRQKAVAEYRDLSEEEPTEIRAGEAGLSYIKLEGNIACLVNGAGLAMATMDIIKLHGGEPANFLDVGGGADKSQVTEAFRILLSDPNVKAVLVNIFGGIARCSTIAEAIVAASKEVGFEVPLVVRLEGTEVEEGRRILEESDVEIITATDLTDAATKVCAAIGA